MRAGSNRDVPRRAAAGKGRFVFIIPVYNHGRRVADVARGALAFGFPVFVIDDGSTDETRDALQDVQGITLLCHEVNRGKGAALKTGFTAAAQIADWAITLDADGQHDPSHAAHLIDAMPDDVMQMRPRPIIIGAREDMSGSDVPWTSRFGREFSNFWVRASGGPRLRDSQSGFRIYPLPDILYLSVSANRFQFEVEVLAKAGWNRVPVIEAPVGVTYTPGMKRVSHFRPFVDFMRNTATFSRCIFLRIVLPPSLRRRISCRHPYQLTSGR